MDAAQLGSMLSNLDAAVRSHIDVFERIRLELGSYDEMRERGDGREKMAERTSKGLPGQVARFIEMADRHGEIAKLLDRSTDEVAAFVWNTMLTSMAFSCIAIEIYTTRLMQAGDSLEDAIATIEGLEWLQDQLRKHDPS
jgi:hypothetical protein